jgi:hypothetical protein
MQRGLIKREDSMDDMDAFIGAYLLMLVVGAIGFVVFWGAVIFFAVKFFQSNNGLTSEQKLGVIGLLMRMFSGGGGSSEPGPVTAQVEGMAA